MLAALIVAVFLPLIPAAAQSVSYNAAYQNEPTIGTTTLNGVTYTTVGYQGLYNTMEAGMPSLPVEYIRFSVPWNATDFSVKATCAKVRMIPLNYPVLPSQTLDGGGFTLPDVNAYATGSTFPAQVAQVIDEDRVAGENHTVTIAVMPMVYSRGNTGDTLQAAESVNLTLSYSLITPNGLIPKYRRDTTLRNEGFDFTRGLVVNPDDVRGNAFCPSSATGLRMPDEQLPTDNPSTYIIVTSGNLRHPLRRLAALKRQKGIPVKIVTVAEAISDPWASGGDYYYGPFGDSTLITTNDFGKLRQYLKINYYHNGTEYALLAGDSIPVATCDVYDTDVYYSDVNSNWSFGQSGSADYQVGRLFGSEPREFDNYTDKLLRYELNPGKGDRSYLSRALSTRLHETDISSDVTYELSNIFSDVTWMAPEIDEYEIKGCDLLDTIRTNRYGCISTLNDGFPSGIKVYDDYEGASHYLWAIDTLKVAPNVIDNETGNGLNLMDNKNYPAVYFSLLGKTMPFSTVTGYGTGPNYGKSFTMGKDYGGPAFLGLTYNLQANRAKEFSKYFLQHLRTHTVITEAIYYTHYYHYYYLAQDMILPFNYLGDPAIDLWTDAPLEYNSVTVARTNSSISVTGIMSGATVSYCENDGSVGKVTATSSSVSLTDVDPNSTVMVYAHNYIPYIAPLVLQNTDIDQSQYVIAHEVLAGRQVDSNRTNGDVTVKEGAEYEIEAAGEVKLAGGFSVEKGAAFAIRPASF